VNVVIRHGVFCCSRTIVRELPKCEFNVPLSWEPVDGSRMVMVPEIVGASINRTSSALMLLVDLASTE